MGKDKETEHGFRGSEVQRFRVQEKNGHQVLNGEKTEIVVEYWVVVFSFDVGRSMFIFQSAYGD